MRRCLWILGALWVTGCTAASRPLPLAPLPAPSEPPASLEPEPAVVSPPVPPPPASVEPPAHPEPPYDLAADLEARKQAIREGVSSKIRFEVIEGVFLVAALPGTMNSSALVARKAITAYYHGRFARRPSRAVTVLLFDAPGPYERYCQAQWQRECSSSLGFYMPRDRVVSLNAGPGIGTLTHELVHPIIEADFHSAPTWLNEGIASLYEGFSLPRDGEIRGHKNWRHPTMQQALRSASERAHVSLPALFALSDAEFRGERESLNYATARAFCLWLESQGKLWAFYQAWRDGHETDPTGEKALRAVMGKSAAELDATWIAWSRAL